MFPRSSKIVSFGVCLGGVFEVPSPGSVEVQFVLVVIRSDEKHRFALPHHPKVHLVESESSLVSWKTSEKLSLSSFSSVFELVQVQFVHPSSFWPGVSWLQ